jgi:hypothetical protein
VHVVVGTKSEVVRCCGTSCFASKGGFIKVTEGRVVVRDCSAWDTNLVGADLKGTVLFIGLEGDVELSLSNFSDSTVGDGVIEWQVPGSDIRSPPNVTLCMFTGSIADTLFMYRAHITFNLLIIVSHRGEKVDGPGYIVALSN